MEDDVQKTVESFGMQLTVVEVAAIGCRTFLEQIRHCQKETQSICLLTVACSEDSDLKAKSGPLELFYSLSYSLSSS